MRGEQAVTFITRSGPTFDALGNATYVETETTDDGWLFAPAGFTELVQGQNTVIQNPSLYKFGGTTAPSAIDAVIVGGVKYEVDGQPQIWPMGVVIRLENVTG